MWATAAWAEGVWAAAVDWAAAAWAEAVWAAGGMGAWAAWAAAGEAKVAMAWAAHMCTRAAKRGRARGCEKA